MSLNGEGGCFDFFDRVDGLFLDCAVIFFKQDLASL